MTLRIAIVGYGIAGIAAAVFLRRLGHDIVHFEQADRPSTKGAGLLLQPTGLAILQDLGLHDQATARGAVISRLTGEGRRGKPIMELRYDEFESDNFGLGIQRGALFALLRGADTRSQDLHTSQRIVDADVERGYLIERQGRRIGQFDLIIGADGADSMIRKSLGLPFRRHRSYAWGALLCLLEDTSQNFSTRLSQYFSEAEHVSIWPVGSLEPSAPRCINLSWRTASPNPREDFDLESWKRRISELCPVVMPLLSQISNAENLLPAFYRDVQLRSYTKGRVALIGDAAHSMSPQLGQGASMALLDAHVLAAAVGQFHNVPSALSAFDRTRRKHVAIYQWISRAMTPVFQSGNPILVMLRDHLFHLLSRVSVIRQAMLKTLCGQQFGMFGILPQDMTYH